MDTQRTLRSSRRSAARDRLTACAIAFCVTLLAAPGHAVDFPAVPLQSQAPYPPANVRFILDDSGSMNFVAMPNDVKDLDDKTPYGSGVQEQLYTTITDKSYVHNSIYYNPATTYQPWVLVDGSDKDSRFTGGTSYSSAYWHPSLLSHEVDLGKTVQTFFVPKTGAPAGSTKERDYIRYQILPVPAGGKLRVVRSEWLAVADDNEGVLNAGCAVKKEKTAWRQCAFKTPTTDRDEAAEMTNFATWYSYHRSRMKVAKAGASEAFSQLKDDLRIGFDSINRNVNGYAIPYAIPVGTDGGRFKGANRKDWFNTLQAAKGLGGTPLHRALQRAGDDLADVSATGPWGPEVGDKQISCRQNFAILTTDGYWNSIGEDYRKIGDADGTAGTKYTPKGGGEPWGYEVVKPYYDNFVETKAVTRADTLADVAMHYWKNDLRTELENNVPESFDDPAFWQHMVTFGVSIGLKGRLDPKAGDLDQVGKGSKHWGDPLAPANTADADRIDDLWHAAVNSRGDFLVASNTKEFVQGLLEAFATVAQRLGSASNVTANSTSFIKDTRVYQASYMSGKWTGELAAFDASEAGVSSKAVWKASEKIPAVNRNIFTWNGAAGDTFPTSSQISALDDSGRLIAPVTGANNAAYLTGERTLERQNQTNTIKGELRNRDHLLGDIVNSSPMYVKESESIFVGANDGMLHAFDALTGVEKFAYVPGGINLGSLKKFSSPQYVHNYFVDGPVVVSARKQTGGKNYLVGSLGRGGKGVFGLDVTDPSKFKAANVLWELSSGDNLGNVLGEPIIVTLNGGTKAVVFGNGYNSKEGKAVLYVVNIATGEVLQEIDTGVGSDNGLAAPRGWDNDANGTVDYIYAGDLKGNLWKFDFTDASGDGSLALGGKALIEAGSGQPMTGGLALARDLVTGKRWVFVGTGRFMTQSDVKDATTQAIYGVIDDNEPVAKADMQVREIMAIEGKKRAFEPHSKLPAGKKGWYLELDEPTKGERVISRPQVRGSVLLFASIIPPTGDACEAEGGGYVNAIDVFTGTSLPKGYFAGMDPIGSGKWPVGSVDLDVGMPTLPTVIDNLLVVGGSDGGIGSAKVNPQGPGAQRISWREILRD